jgi:hypothetical protein
VRIAEGGEAVGDGEGREAVAHALDGGLDLGLGFGVQNFTLSQVKTYPIKGPTWGL